LRRLGGAGLDLLIERILQLLGGSVTPSMRESMTPWITNGPMQ
jgi:hypothetical protein